MACKLFLWSQYVHQPLVFWYNDFHKTSSRKEKLSPKHLRQSLADFPDDVNKMRLRSLMFVRSYIFAWISQRYLYIYMVENPLENTSPFNIIHTYVHTYYIRNICMPR